jgi:nucleotide-binding universal stress UspA family protein
MFKVLVYRQAFMYKKILVPTDGSTLSEQGATSAIEFARAQGAAIVAVSVAQPYPLMASEAAIVTDSALDTRVLLQLAQDSVDKVAQLAQSAGVACTTATAMSFSPHEEIIRAATDNGCDLIYMASHGRRGLSKLLAGSVTQNVLAYSTIPVLVLRPELPS